MPASGALARSKAAARAIEELLAPGGRGLERVEERRGDDGLALRAVRVEIVERLDAAPRSARGARRRGRRARRSASHDVGHASSTRS